MNLDLQAVAAWLAANPEFVYPVLGFLLYWARAAMPRKPPSSPFWFALWEAENKILALPWDRWLGKPHIPGKIVPDLVQWRAEQPTKREHPLPPKEGGL